MKAPDFNLQDQNGKYHQLSDYKGKWLVVYFYPKDDTTGCTKEACSFRDMSDEFKKKHVSVVGISKDTVASHKKFEEKYTLNFTLLANPDHSVIEAYGSWGEKSMMGKKYMGTLRNTYIVNPEGKIVKTYEKVDPVHHADKILSDLDSFLTTS